MIQGSSLQTTVHKLLCHQERARILSQFIRYTFRKVWFTVTYQDLYKILKQDNLDIYILLGDPNAVPTINSFMACLFHSKLSSHSRTSHTQHGLCIDSRGKGIGNGMHWTRVSPDVFFLTPYGSVRYI